MFRSCFGCPVNQLLTICYASTREKERPHMHLKNSIVKNMYVYFKKTKAQINKNGSMKDYLKEASKKRYRTGLISCFIDPSNPSPSQLLEYNSRRYSKRNRTEQPALASSNTSYPPAAITTSQTTDKKQSPSFSHKRKYKRLTILKDNMIEIHLEDACGTLLK